MERKNGNHMPRFREILWRIEFFQASLCKKAEDISGRYPLQRQESVT